MNFFEFMFNHIHPMDYIYIPIFFVFALILLVVARKTLKICHKEKYKQLSKPTREYVGCRILAALILNKRLPGIIKQARGVIDPSKKIGNSRTWHKLAMLGLLDKLYDDLLETANYRKFPSKSLHRAVHFEIKKRTMNNPYYLIGSRICKMIAAGYNEIRIIKEESRQKSRIYIWCCQIKYFSRYILQKIKKFQQKQPLIKIYFTSILVVTCVGAFCTITYLPNLITWLEGTIIALLVVLITILIIRWRNSFPTYTRISVIKAIAFTTLSALSLYLYDTSTDIEVILVYFGFYRTVTEGINQTYDKYNMTITNPYFNIYGNLSHWETLHDNKTYKMILTLSFWQFTFGWYCCMFSFILLCSTILSFKSLPSIANKIKTSIFLDGNQIKSKRVGQIQKLKKKEAQPELLTTQEILTRNKHAIEEAGVESTYQFIFTAVIYFCFSYVIAISKDTSATVFHFDKMVSMVRKSQARQILQL